MTAAGDMQAAADVGDRRLKPVGIVLYRRAYLKNSNNIKIIITEWMCIYESLRKLRQLSHKVVH